MEYSKTELGDGDFLRNVSTPTCLAHMLRDSVFRNAWQAGSPGKVKTGTPSEQMYLHSQIRSK